MAVENLYLYYKLGGRLFERKENIEYTKYIDTKKAGLCLLVVWGGIEPPTQGFSVLCSTD